jgi:hypothetical protein
VLTEPGRGLGDRDLSAGTRRAVNAGSLGGYTWSRVPMGCPLPRMEAGGTEGAWVGRLARPGRQCRHCSH